MKRTLCLVLFIGLMIQTAPAQQYTQRGAVVGGAAGALTGAALGKRNGNTTEGALIGGALGLVTGAAIGNSVDRDNERARAYQYQRQQRIRRAVSTQDVVSMVQNGVAEQVIISHIRQNGVQRRIEVKDVIALHRQGVNENIITALQQAPLATAPRPASSYRRPVVIQEHYYPAPAPRYYYPPVVRYRSAPIHYHHHQRYHRHPRNSFSWSVRF